MENKVTNLLIIFIEENRNWNIIKKKNTMHHMRNVGKIQRSIGSNFTKKIESLERKHVCIIEYVFRVMPQTLVWGTRWNRSSRISVVFDGTRFSNSLSSAIFHRDSPSLPPSLFPRFCSSTMAQCRSPFTIDFTPL